MSGVRFFGQFLIDCGEVDASHVREALNLMDRENASIAEIAVKLGFMSDVDVKRVNAEQRNRDMPCGDLAVDMGLLSSEQLVEVLQRQRSRRLPIGQALVSQGCIELDRLGVLLDEFKADQAQFDTSSVSLPDGLANRRVTQYVLDLLPRYMLRVGGIRAKVGEIRAFEDVPEFGEVRVSVPMKGARGVDVAIAADLAFSEALAVASSGLDPRDLDQEMVADGVGEFLNVLCGNAGSLAAREGHRLELGAPDYEAELCDGWTVDLAVGVGRAAMVLSTY